MKNSTSECPKCGQTMGAGHFLISTEDKLGVVVWAPGSLERTIFWSPREPTTPAKPVQSRRCDGCGFVELYAP